MRARAIAVMLSATLVAMTWPAAAAAQASQEVTTAVTIAALYDENVIWRPDAQSDHVWRVTPSIDLTRRSVRSRFRIDGLIDGEWYSRFRTLSTIGARQHGGLMWDYRATDTDTLGLTAGYDNSVNTSQINVGTGLLLGRLRAWRWFVAPEHIHGVNGRTGLVSTYKLTGEFAARPQGVLVDGPGVLIHGGQFEVVQQVGDRDELRPGYLGELFQFRGFEQTVSHRGMLRWTHRLTPSIRTVVSGGARMADDVLKPEVEISIARRAGFSNALASYNWGRTTALGINRLVEVHHAHATAGYSGPSGLGAWLSGAFYRSGLDEERAQVYRVAVDAAVPIFRPLSIEFSGAVDYQRGRVGIPLVPTFELLPEAPQGSQFLVAPNAPIRRSTIMVSFVLSGTHKSAAGPAERPRQEDRFSERRRR